VIGGVARTRRSDMDAVGGGTAARRMSTSVAVGAEGSGAGMAVGIEAGSPRVGVAELRGEGGASLAVVGTGGAAEAEALCICAIFSLASSSCFWSSSITLYSSTAARRRAISGSESPTATSASSGRIPTETTSSPASAGRGGMSVRVVSGARRMDGLSVRG